MLQSKITTLRHELQIWKYWKNVDYFQSDFYDKNNAAIVTIQDEIFYWDIYSWIKQIEKTAKIKKKKLVTWSLSCCFWKKAMMWHVLLTQQEKQALQTLSLEDEWIKALLRQFEQQCSKLYWQLYQSLQFHRQFYQQPYQQLYQLSALAVSSV